MSSRPPNSASRPKPPRNGSVRKSDNREDTAAVAAPVGPSLLGRPFRSEFFLDLQRVVQRVLNYAAAPFPGLEGLRKDSQAGHVVDELESHQSRPPPRVAENIAGENGQQRLLHAPG